MCFTPADDAKAMLKITTGLKVLRALLTASTTLPPEQTNMSSSSHSRISMQSLVDEPPFSVNILQPSNNNAGFHAVTAQPAVQQAAPVSRINANSTTHNIDPASPDPALHPFFSLLPASSRSEKDDLEDPTASIDTFLHREFNVERLTAVHKWLWVAGRPMPARALNRQRNYGRTIVLTEQMDMHLVWSGSQIFIKPLPRFLLDPDFWKESMRCSSTCVPDHRTNTQAGCERRKLWRIGLGFLLSYVALIAYESDYFLAKELRLLPDEVSWSNWKLLVCQVLSRGNIYNQVDKRFIYGELRLGRLNKIYRLTGKSLLRGYKLRYNEYGAFFQDNFTWLASILVYVAIVLTAMQVGLATRRLENNNAFQAVSYGFTVFSIIGPLVVVMIVLLVFTFGFLGNFVQTLEYKKQRLGRIGVL